MNSSRSNEMDITRKAVKKSYKSFKGTDPLNDSFCHIYKLLNRRMNDRGIRSLFVRLIYQYVKEQAEKEKIQLRKIDETVFLEHLPFVAEAMIAVQYYENQILDGKGGLRDMQNNWNKAKIDHNLLAGHLIKDELYNFIEDKIFPKNSEDAKVVTKTVRRIFRYVDLGQEFQDQYGTLEAWQSDLHGYQSISLEIDAYADKKIINEFWESLKSIPGVSQKEWFVKNYLKRIYLTTGSLFLELARMVMDLVGYGGIQREKILKFAITHGILGQLVNDNNDIMLPEYNLATISKVPEDAFADLRNNNITLPLIIFLSNSKEDNPELEVMHLQMLMNKKEKTRPWFARIMLFFIPRKYKTSVEKYLNPTQTRQAFDTLLSSVKGAISLVENFRKKLTYQHLLQDTVSGQMLYDMNSMADIDHNKYSAKIMSEETSSLEYSYSRQRRSQKSAVQKQFHKIWSKRCDTPGKKASMRRPVFSHSI